VLKTLVAKIMASHFHKEAHFEKMQEALQKVCAMEGIGVLCCAMLGRAVESCIAVLCCAVFCCAVLCQTGQWKAAFCAHSGV